MRKPEEAGQRPEMPGSTSLILIGDRCELSKTAACKGASVRSHANEASV